MDLRTPNAPNGSGRGGRTAASISTSSGTTSRYRIRGASSLPGYEPTPVFPDACGQDEPGLLGVFAGISPGYGDRYLPHLEGQYIDITRLRAGRYVLVHRANPGGRLLESDHANNAASVLVEVRWPRGYGRRPSVRVIETCPESASCAA